MGPEEQEELKMYMLRDLIFLEDSARKQVINVS